MSNIIIKDNTTHKYLSYEEWVSFEDTRMGDYCHLHLPEYNGNTYQETIQGRNKSIFIHLPHEEYDKIVNHCKAEFEKVVNGCFNAYKNDFEERMKGSDLPERLKLKEIEKVEIELFDDKKVFQESMDISIIFNEYYNFLNINNFNFRSLVAGYVQEGLPISYYNITPNFKDQIDNLLSISYQNGLDLFQIVSIACAKGKVRYYKYLTDQIQIANGARQSTEVDKKSQIIRTGYVLKDENKLKPLFDILYPEYLITEFENFEKLFSGQPLSEIEEIKWLKSERLLAAMINYIERYLIESKRNFLKIAELIFDKANNLSSTIAQNSTIRGWETLEGKLQSL